MLRSVIIMSGSGIVIFEKSWDKTTNESVNQWGGLIRTICEFSSQSVGYPVSYLETTSAALSVISDTKTGVICAIIHSNEDTSEFGELIAKEILRTFLESFAQVDFSKQINNKGQFNSFGPKIVDCIKRVADTIIQNLSTVNGIEACLLVYEDGTEAISSKSDSDIPALANFRELWRVARKLMQEKDDDVLDFMLLDMGERFVFVHKIKGMVTLVTLSSKRKKKKSESESDGKEDDMEFYYAKICRHQKLLKRVFMLGSYFTTGK
uniref:Uncharacterized protein n=1 Tax=Arcella intermedia TaxID=1963864 RepID=A0A6B2LE33_9EUKA